MAGSANVPALGNKIVVDVPALNALIRQMIQAELSGVTDLPTRAKQMVEGANGWEIQQFNGSSWVRLADWNLNAQQVDGFSASQSAAANTIAVRNSSGKLAGDILGNAATATKAAALSAVNPVGMGGTGGTTAAQARENLGITDLLEALDAAMVHKTGDETIAGVKTLTGKLIKHGNLASSGASSGYVYICNGAGAADGGGIWMYGAEHDNAGKVRLQARNYTVAKYCALDVNADGTLTHKGLDGVARNLPRFVDGVEADASGSVTLTGVVHKTGDETIGGVKTFTASPVVQGSVPALDLVQTDMELGGTVLPTALQASYLRFFDKNKAVQASVFGAFSQGGISSANLVAYDPKNTGSFATLQVAYQMDGTKYGSSPTTPAGSTGTQILTADYAQSMGGVTGTAKSLGNVDVDTVLTPGFYYLSGDGTKLPSGTNGYVQVLSASFAGSGYIRQIFWRTGTAGSTDHHIYTRLISSGSPGPWVQMMTAKGGTFTAAINAPTPAASSNDTTVSTTAWCRARSQWKYKKIVLATDGTIGERELDFTSYLPSDGEEYEVLMRVRVERADSSGTNTVARIFLSSGEALIMIQADGANWQQQSESCVFPVPASRKLKYDISGYASSNFEIAVYAYRKA